ncbi:unnamed protein product [Auanema sp. JU1783]|nr:unnamed protein product [Auanema sp. JU1783]
MVKRNLHIEGSCSPGFEAVEKSFRNNFGEGWERGGASFAVFHNGIKVVDIWGGYADRECNRLWREDTLTTIFSCTKSIAAICVSRLIDHGLCDYNDKIIKYWPEFGQHGKENVTLQMILSHKAGLPFFNNKVLSLPELIDENLMSKIIEECELVFEPNSKTAYHPLTFGWLIDQVFRRIDPNKRTIGVFFKEEIADKYHLDVHIGNCANEESRTARLTDLHTPLTLREVAYDKCIAKIGKYYFNPRGYFNKALQNMRNFGKNFILYNNPELRIAGQAAVNGIATARGLAELHQLFMDHTIISPQTFQKIAEPLFVKEFDHTIGEVQSKGFGFMYTQSPEKTWQIGHSGVGGQIVKMDPSNHIVIAYLTNAMKAGTGEHVFTCNRLTRKVYECLKKLPSS